MENYGNMDGVMPDTKARNLAKASVTMINAGLLYLKTTLVHWLMSFLMRFFTLDFQNTRKMPSMTQRRLYRMYMASFLSAQTRPIFPDDEDEDDEYYK